MSNYTVFHKTVRGASHIRRETPSEDASSSFSQEEGLYHIAVVADGHGDPSCFRSSIGSKTAVTIAEECLKSFAETALATRGSDRAIEEELSILKKRTLLLKQLTDSIISRWAEAVLRELAENPITEEELQAAGSKAADYSQGNNLEHIYGTTLMAALLIGKKLILLHQGDGRCDVFYEDGTVDQPIPWDDRCQGNATTSMCQADAAESIRTCVLDLGEKPVIGCFLGSDGVEDSFRNMEGTHVFYRKLSCKLVSQELTEFEAYLEDMLPKFSASGSQDDVSVAGIVDIEGLKAYAEEFQSIAESYDREEKIYILQYKQAEYQKRLDEDMPRKLGILAKQAEDAKQKLAECLNRQQECKEDLDRLQQTQEAKDGELQEAQNDEFFLRETENRKNPVMRMIYARCQTIFSQSEASIEELKQSITAKETLLGQLDKECTQLETACQKAEQAYNEYNDKYEQAKEVLKEINDVLENLNGESAPSVEQPTDAPNEEEVNG